MKVFSAIRPSGKLTIGNYFGAISQWLELQKSDKCVFAVADYHAITTSFEPEKIREYRKDYLSWFLAAGLDPNKSTIFIGSQNPDHTDLTWILSCLVSDSELRRMTQYKDKKEKEQIITAGLLNYPILQAADILLYDTEIVPVGEDQKQHVEFTRKLARKFNNKYGEVFIEPEAKTIESSARIMSLTDPTSKMSKSGSNKSKINLNDDPQEVKEKIISAVTDSGSEIKYDLKEKPAISNLIDLFCLFSGKSRERVEENYKGEGYGKFKEDLAELVAKFLGEIQEKKEEIVAKNISESVLERGLKQAREISTKKLNQVKKAIGLD
jgi:tryptophanyl-tRNA synthetase